jgi:hypothetical protein
MSQYALGSDLGPVAEFTALAVLEQDRARPTNIAVRHLVRFPPGTPYRAIGEAVATTVRDGGLGRPPIVVDLTAVGPGLLPMLREAVRPAWLDPVILTAAQGSPGKDADGIRRLPKRDLVTTLQLLLQDRRLRVAPTLPEATLLAHELTTFRAKVSLSETDAVDWRERPADDLVLAVALAADWLVDHPPHDGTSPYGADNSELMTFLDRVFGKRTWSPSAW